MLRTRSASVPERTGGVIDLGSGCCAQWYATLGGLNQTKENGRGFLSHKSENYKQQENATVDSPAGTLTTARGLATYQAYDMLAPDTKAAGRVTGDNLLRGCDPDHEALNRLHRLLDGPRAREAVADQPPLTNDCPKK